MCRENNVGYIGSQTFGPWGFAFVDYGDKHVVTDHNGEQTKNFVVSMIDKGEKTFVTVHEDKRHIYEEGDSVTFREVEGMSEINDSGPYVITKTTPFTFTLDLDSREFGDYTRQGTVENVKVPKEFPMHSWETSFANPAASTEFGMLNPPDLSKFGRSEQLHAALFGIEQFVINKD
jgi:ubiquitin-activating enzyme E1